MTDILFGLAEGLAVKAPCHVATDDPVTLYGLQTIDGIDLTEGRRVLVTNQPDPTTNGIYVASSGRWRRARDCNGNRDFMRGMRVLVNRGTLYGRTQWVLTSADPHVIGSSRVTFETVCGRTVTEPDTETVFAVIQAISFGRSTGGTPMLQDANGDDTGSDMAITGATVRYSRVDTFPDPNNTTPKVSVYTEFDPTDTVGNAFWGYFSLDYVSNDIVVAPNLRARTSGGGTVSDLQIFDASDTTGIDAYYATLGTTRNKYNWTLSRLAFQATFLLESPSSFTITNDGFEMSLAMYLYPADGIAVDTANTSYGFAGGASDGHVWFPIKFTPTPPPYPNDPFDEEWPGYTNVTSDSGTDVTNAALIGIRYELDAGSGSYPMEVARKPHLSDPPVDNAMVRDEIWEIYPTTIEGDNYWIVDKPHYADVPYGYLFDVPLAWNGASFTVPGPLPLITEDQPDPPDPPPPPPPPPWDGYIGWQRSDITNTPHDNLTFAGVDIGTPAADRVVIAAISYAGNIGNDSDPMIFGVTINGSAMTRVADAVATGTSGGNAFCVAAIFTKVVTSGTTATIVIDGEDGNVWAAELAIYAKSGLTSTTPFDTAALRTTNGADGDVALTGSVDIDNNGFAIVVRAMDAALLSTLTGATVDHHDIDWGENEFSHRVVTTGETFVLDSSWSPSTDVAIAAATWR